MKLDRNINGDGRGKYGLIKQRRVAEIMAWDGGEGEALDRQAMINALELLERAGVIDYGTTPDTEFFVIRLKDRYAGRALSGYAKAVDLDPQGDDEYAREVTELALRAGLFHPHNKRPD